MLLADRVAVITGGAGLNGLGFATARLMASHGARVVILDLEGAEPAAAAASLGDGHLGLVADVTDKASCDAAVAACSRRSAASTCWSTTPASRSRARRSTSPTPTTTRCSTSACAARCCMSQAVIPAMQRQRSGSIVCISSVSAQRGGGILGGPHYSAAKAGVLGLARAMARELGPDGIRVNSITPGLIADRHQQGQAHRRAQGRDRQRRSRSAASACADDVAGACLFLASDLSSYCTGITLDVNGGMLIH